MKTYKLAVFYDGSWVEDMTIEAESDSEAYEKATQQAIDNLEVKHKNEL